jgi:hypothetical protein
MAQLLVGVAKKGTTTDAPISRSINRIKLFNEARLINRRILLIRTTIDNPNGRSINRIKLSNEARLIRRSEYQSY